MTAIGVRGWRRLLLLLGHRAAVLGYLAFALFPLFWLVQNYALCCCTAPFRPISATA